MRKRSLIYLKIVFFLTAKREAGRELKYKYRKYSDLQSLSSRDRLRKEIATKIMIELVNSNHFYFREYDED